MIRQVLTSSHFQLESAATFNICIKKLGMCVYLAKAAINTPDHPEPPEGEENVNEKVIFYSEKNLVKKMNEPLLVFSRKVKLRTTLYLLSVLQKKT